MSGARDFGGKCRVPMWSGFGVPAGHCNKQAFGEQLPQEVLFQTRNWRESPYCYGPCCPEHGGPSEGEPILFHDGYTPKGRRMWCAVLPGFRNIQEDPAGFDENGNTAIKKLRDAIELMKDGAA